MTCVCVCLCAQDDDETLASLHERRGGREARAVPRASRESAMAVKMYDVLTINISAPREAWVGYVTNIRASAAEICVDIAWDDGDALHCTQCLFAEDLTREVASWTLMDDAPALLLRLGNKFLSRAFSASNSRLLRLDSAPSIGLSSLGMIGIFCDHESLPDLLRSTLPATNFFFSTCPGFGLEKLPRVFDLMGKSTVSGTGGVTVLKDMYLCLGYAFPFEFRDLEVAIKAASSSTSALDLSSIFRSENVFPIGARVWTFKKVGRMFSYIMHVCTSATHVRAPRWGGHPLLALTIGAHPC